VYDKVANTTRMTPEAFISYCKHTQTAANRLAANLTVERALLSNALLDIGPDMRRNLANLSGSAVALATNDLFEIWPFLLEAVFPPGAFSSIKAYKDLVSLSQTGELSDYLKFTEAFRLLIKEFVKKYQDNSKTGLNGARTVPEGYVKIDTLLSTIFLAAISGGDESQFFRFLMDKKLGDIATVHDLESPETLIAAFQTFRQNLRSDSEATTEASLAYLAHAKSAGSASVSAGKDSVSDPVLCATCGQSFSPEKPFHHHCSKCQVVRIAKLKKDKAALAAKAHLAKVGKSTIEEDEASKLAEYRAYVAASDARVLLAATPSQTSQYSYSHLPLHVQQFIQQNSQVPERPAGFLAGVSQFVNTFSDSSDTLDDSQYPVDFDFSTPRALIATVPSPPAPPAPLPPPRSMLPAATAAFSQVQLNVHAARDALQVGDPRSQAALDLAIQIRDASHDDFRRQARLVTSMADSSRQLAGPEVVSHRIDPPVVIVMPPPVLGSVLPLPISGAYLLGDASGGGRHHVSVPPVFLTGRVMSAPSVPHVDDAGYQSGDSMPRLDSDSSGSEDEEDVERPCSFVAPSTPAFLHSAAYLDLRDDSAPLLHPSSDKLACVDDLLVSPITRALVAVVQKFSDTGASFHTTGRLSILSNCVTCHVPCGGIGSGVVFTHVGIDKSMPEGARMTYYGAGIAELLSLGYLHATGRCSSIQDGDGPLEVYYDKVLLFCAARRANNLYPVDTASFSKHPAVSVSDVSDEECAALRSERPKPSTGFSVDKLASLSTLCLSATDAVTACVPRKLNTDCLYSAPSLSASIPTAGSTICEPQAYQAKLNTYNREQRERISLASELERYLHFQSTEAVATGLSMGSFARASPLDAKDMRNLQDLRGPSPHYLAGYFQQKSMPPSTTAPAPSPGHTLSFDISKLKVKSINGYTHEIRVVSEFEGYLAVLPARSKDSKDLFEAVHTFIATTYNARSYRVVKANADAEGVMKSMTAVFGSIGIVLTLSPPGQHAQRCERYTQQLNKGARATLDSLPYVLPPEFMLYLDMSVADGTTLVPNSASFPLSPYEKVHQQRRVFHATLPFLPFGAVCSVGMGVAKRDAIGHKLQYHTADVAKSEIGVCLGADPAFPASYIFYVHSTRKIVPRRVIKVLTGVIPFGWQPKTSMFQTLKQFPVDHEPAVLPNVPIQQLPKHSPELHESKFQDAILDQPVKNVQFLPSAEVTHSAPVPVAVSTPSIVVPLAPSSISAGRAIPTSVLPTIVPPPLYVPSPLMVATPPISAPSPPVSVRNAIVSTPSQSSAPHLPTPPVLRSARSRKPAAVFTYDALGGNPHGYFGSAASVVATLEDNYVLPLQSVSPLPAPRHLPVSQPSRQRTFHHTAKPPTRTNVSWVPAVDDESWYVPPLPPPIRKPRALLVPRVDSTTTEVASLLANVSAVKACVPELVVDTLERTLNIHELPPDVLSTVAFISEVSPAKLPPGLRAPLREQHEVSYNHAKAHPEQFPPDQVRAGTAKEMDKMTTGMEVFELVTDAATQIDKDALFVPSMMLVKQKYHPSGDKDVISCRFAMIGSHTDPKLFGDTSAATADEATMLCAMAAFQADAIQRGYIDDIEYAAFDVCGAFLHTALVSPVMIVTRIPKNLDHPLAGRTVIIRKSCYGLRQSNKTFADDFDKTIQSAGFLPTTDPCVYKKIVHVPDAPSQRCYISTHVDDGKAVFNHRPLYDHLVSVLEARYGTLKKAPLTGFTGTSFLKHANGAFTRSQDGYILRFLDSVGIVGLAPSKVPSQADLFDDTTHSPPCDQSLYRTLIGSLIHTLKTRYDIQKEVVHLSSKNSCPTDADLAKVILVLRYLNGTHSLGPTYYTQQGPVLSCFVDCSYGVHVDGRSHAGFTLHIGSDSAPFFVSSKKQNDCVAVGSMEGEYVALSLAARKVLEFRYFMESIEFVQMAPTVVYEDNMSAINLAQAPAVTRKSRHIHIRHHFIRNCVDEKSIRVEHLSTDKMLADFLTKPFGPKKYISFRDQLFNKRSIPV
jgi:hypothetical protein